MPDLGTLTALLGSVKTSVDLAKAIKNADFSLEKAETKLKFAELIESLAETKIQAAEIKILFEEKDAEIERLKGIIKIKAQMVKRHNAYYRKGELGIVMAEPFCTHCWDNNQKPIHLLMENDSAGNWIGKCPACKNAGYVEFYAYE